MSHFSMRVHRLYLYGKFCLCSSALNISPIISPFPTFSFNKNIYFAVAVSLCPLFILSYCANIPASNVPEIECHTQDTAQIIADSGVDANWAVVVARFVANPAFCIPTSIELFVSLLCSFQ